MNRKSSNFLKVLIAFLATWSGVLFLHFIFEMLKTIVNAVIADAARVYAVVVRPSEVLFALLVALITALVVTLMILIKRKKDATSTKSSEE